MKQKIKEEELKKKNQLKESLKATSLTNDLPTKVKEIKPGYKTTEFWATIAYNVAVLITNMINGDTFSSKYVYIPIALATGLYAISRGISKK